ncbi:LAME_0E02146g1_1 [Lachancea meyersii CBS 8951]|uniref:LAME_0E02146g1_1 n=1 Tax=Lachancea meyersii CBS 8951 TaxID=1266667 RepID=A0A1G4JFK5_9SACH|nr:LAME_0E02146g1_1 [Lachancea meyersii CBS 8951]
MASYVDAHCHVTTSTKTNANPISLSDLPVVRCVMSNNSYDWQKIKNLKDSDPRTKVGFGVHPWYSHLYYIADQGHPPSKDAHYRSVLQCSDTSELEQIICRLPEPVSLSDYIHTEFEIASCDCIGEIGLDKLFRLPENGFYQGDDHAPLSRVKVSVEHQAQIFIQMCRLATIHSLPVSIHSVKCPSLVFDLCQEHLLPHSNVNVCLHSFTGSLETLTGVWLKKFPHERLFLSLSSYINFKNLDSAAKLVQALPPHCILAETDFTWDTADDDTIIRELDFVLSQIALHQKLQSKQEAKELIYTNYQRFIL